MKKTLDMEGIACPRCEARIKKALEAVAGVDEAVVSKDTQTAVVTLTQDVADTVLAEAAALGGSYTVKGVRAE